MWSVSSNSVNVQTPERVSKRFVCQARRSRVKRGLVRMETVDEVGPVAFAAEYLLQL